MDRLGGEQKKDVTDDTMDQKGGGSDVDATEEAIDEKGSDTGGADDQDDQDDCKDPGDLPLEMACLSDQVFQSEEALQEALDNARFGDLRVVLAEGKAHLVIPSNQHNLTTDSHVAHFTVNWGENKWGVSSGTHKLHLPNGRSHDPDVSWWGHPRCSKHPRTDALLPINRSTPDVVILFGWRNTRSCEEEAINDMMNRGLVQDH